MYLRLDESHIVDSEEVAPGIVLDYNEAEQVVGMEMLNLSKRSPDLSLSSLQLQIEVATGIGIYQDDSEEGAPWPVTECDSKTTRR